tara:strand:- start:18305 stop:18793 length:489 start_codon:yes stop_codon:yes gene_type:complete
MSRTGRLKKSEADRKKRQGQRMFINGISKDEIAEILEVHIETINRWYRDYNWQADKDLHSISIGELKREVLQTYSDIKEGKQPKVSADQLSKLAATFEKFSDKKKALAYMYENFEQLSDAIIKDALSERTKKAKEEKLGTAKYIREMMDIVTAQTYKEALHD